MHLYVQRLFSCLVCKFSPMCPVEFEPWATALHVEEERRGPPAPLYQLVRKVSDVSLCSQRLLSSVVWNEGLLEPTAVCRDRRPLAPSPAHLYKPGPSDNNKRRHKPARSGDRPATLSNAHTRFSAVTAQLNTYSRNTQLTQKSAARVPVRLSRRVGCEERRGCEVRRGEKGGEFGAPGGITLIRQQL